MTESTKTFGIRLEIKDKEDAAKYFTRESMESILRQIRRGEITITRKGIEITNVNTISESVNTQNCDECPYINNLNMTAFDEVCEYKGIDRQKALDKCVQMLWR